MTTALSVPFVDLSRTQEPLRQELDAAISGVLNSGRFLLGEQTRKLQEEFAQHEGSSHGICCGSGSDALFLALRALDIGAGDKVLTVSNSFVATAESIARTGAVVGFVEPDPETRSLEPADLRVALRAPGAEQIRAVIPVHLYGRRARIPAIRDVLASEGREDISIVVDAAQSHGSPGVASEAELVCYSFYPSKNLGAMGDGGIVLTSNEALADRLKKMRNHGRGGKHTVTEVGVNSRFDEIQAAVLRTKLGELRGWNDKRRSAADVYREKLAGIPGLVVPEDAPGHVYHLFVVEVEASVRAQVAAALNQAGIQTGLHYPVAVHQMPPYPSDRALPVTEKLVQRVLSLPIFPGIEVDEIEWVCKVLREELTSGRTDTP